MKYIFCYLFNFHVWRKVGRMGRFKRDITYKCGWCKREYVARMDKSFFRN